MSRRAARTSTAVVTAFAWASDAPARLPEEPARPAAPQPAPAPAVAPPAPPPDAVEEQTRLAAIERDAFTSGYAQGEQAGLEAGSRRSDALARRLGESLDELAALRRTLVQQAERQVVALALAIARRILRREVAVDEALTMALARVALDRLGESAVATVHLHPDDYALASARGTGDWGAAQLTVVADPAVTRGGCLVESPFGFVEAGVDAQFQEIARALLDDGAEVGTRAGL